MSELSNILVLAFMGSVVALGGGVVFLVKRNWSKWLAAYSVPFAAGVLLTTALIGLLPEALHMMGEAALRVTLAAFIGAYLFEHFLFGLHHHEEGCHGKHYETAIPLVIIGDTIHNFIDGVAIAATYMASPGLGVVTTLSTFLHEVPHEIGDFGILLKAGWRRRQIMLVNLVSASFTLLGALTVYGLVQDEMVIGGMLAVAAGMFLYLGASDFLPQIGVGRVSERKSLVALLIGVVVMFAAMSVVPHAHEGELESERGHEEAEGL